MHIEDYHFRNYTLEYTQITSVKNDNFAQMQM